MIENEIPLSEDYDFSELTDEELDLDYEITVALIDHLTNMIAESNYQIGLGNDVINREKMSNLLTMEKEFRLDRLTALNAEKERRLS